ncbi:hypothetical protein Droror1_Dr00013040 [Drosera rotundifolia]
MEGKSDGDRIMGASSDYGRQMELDELNERKFTVKELVDGGVEKIPSIFTLPQEHQPNPSSCDRTSRLRVPVIDLRGVEGDERRVRVVGKIRKACETWGMFQMINHGIPIDVIEGVLEGVRRFNEQEKGLKDEFYTRDSSKKVVYTLSVHPAFKTALWKDTLVCDFDAGLTDPGVPNICRKEIIEYVKHMTGPKNKLSELLSEAMALGSSYLKDIQCLQAQKFIAHYAPACPEPELTMATVKHCDPYFFTILLQNEIDGIQVLHEGQWVDVLPVEGALVGIVGDMLQIISNDLFKSPEHRGLARPIGPRLSIGCFFHPGDENKERVYGPLEELISEDHPKLYKDTSVVDYQKGFWLKGTTGSKALPHFRL